jgi:hypothetical protein
MPTYIAISNVNGNERVADVFEADDDQDSNAKFRQKKLDQYDGPQCYTTHKRAEVDALKYYPRMARPQIGFSSYLSSQAPGPLFNVEENAQPPLPHDAVSMSSSLNQLTILVRNLEEIFRSVEPSQGNMQVYGHLIRNTLLLAAMEFENECKGVLKANGYVPKGQWTTKHFVKVLSPLRLQEYAVDLAFYPAISSRKPFQSWNGQVPTQSLTWYDAYNDVKHDRESKFQRATIKAAINAVTACAIMLAAQYRVIWSWKEQIGGFFSFTQSPQWLPTQRYVFYPDDAGGWKAIYFSF